MTRFHDRQIWGTGSGNSAILAPKSRDQEKPWENTPLWNKSRRQFSYAARCFMPKIVSHQNTPVWFVNNEYFIAKVDVCHSLLPWPGPGRSWIAGPAGISRLGPNSEPRGNNRSFPETRERDRVPVKKIGSRDSIFGLVNSTYSFEITNHNQLVSNIKYLANFIKKYWTYFRYQKLADFLVCLPPSVRV